MGLAVVVALLGIAPRARAALDQFAHAATLTNANGASGDNAGFSVAISADGSTIVVGVPFGNDTQGEAYVYTRGSNGWQTANQPDVLSASNGAADIHFGSSVSVSQDGSVIAVGAPFANGGGDEDGQVYVFDRPGGGWAPQAAQTETTRAAGAANFDFLGTAVALSPDGTYLAAGASGHTGSMNGQGGVYVWSYNGSALSTLGTEPLLASDPGNEDRLGSSIAMPSDRLIYAGSPGHSGSGAVYGFSSLSSSEEEIGPWSDVSQGEFSASGSSLFGSSVSAGGGIVAAGAQDSSANKGAVYLFRPTFRCQVLVITGCFNGSPYTTPLATLTDPSGNGYLGESVAVPADGAAVLAGAPGSAVSGKAYVFQEPSGGWANATTPDATLTPSDSAAGDGFGTAASMSSDGGALAVGDPAGSSATGEADAYEGGAGTTVSCQPGTAGVGQPATCTATVTDEGIAEATPTGTVGFATDSPGSFGNSSCTLASTTAGTSACDVTYTPALAGSGTHTITAHYSGDDKHASGTGLGTVSIDRVTTNTVVSCDPSPVTVGDTASCTATVTASSASAGPPTGSINLKSNGPGKFSATGCTLPAGSGGTADCKFSYTPSAIGPGTHQLTADYSGDGGHAASQGSEPLGVAEDSTNTAVSCRPLSVAVGKSTKCTARVTDARSGGLAPTGRVAGKSTGAGRFSACTLTRLGGDSANCTFTYKPSNAGAPSPRLTLTYDGDDNHFASAAGALLKVPATGRPTVVVGQVTINGGRIVLKLGCPRTEASCKVTVTITVGGRILAAGSTKIRGGSRKALALKPNAAVLSRLGPGKHAAIVALAVTDQARHHKHESFKATLTAGKHLKLVVRK